MLEDVKPEDSSSQLSEEDERMVQLQQGGEGRARPRPRPSRKVLKISSHVAKLMVLKANRKREAIKAKAKVGAPRRESAISRVSFVTSLA